MFKQQTTRIQVIQHAIEELEIPIAKDPWLLGSALHGALGTYHLVKEQYAKYMEELENETFLVMEEKRTPLATVGDAWTEEAGFRLIAGSVEEKRLVGERMAERRKRREERKEKERARRGL